MLINSFSTNNLYFVSLSINKNSKKHYQYGHCKIPCLKCTLNYQLRYKHY